MFEMMTGSMSDIRARLGKRDIWLALAREDGGDSHERTRLGPAWLLLNYLLFIATSLFVFGNQQANYVVYLACGLLAWNFISETITASLPLFFRKTPYQGHVSAALCPPEQQRAEQASLRLKSMIHHIDASFIPKYFTYAAVLSVYLLNHDGDLVDDDTHTSRPRPQEDYLVSVAGDHGSDLR
jgi:hypothetical protein